MEEVVVTNLKEGQHFGELESINITNLYLNKKQLTIAKIKKKYKNKPKQLEKHITEATLKIKTQQCFNISKY